MVELEKRLEDYLKIAQKQVVVLQKALRKLKNREIDLENE